MIPVWLRGTSVDTDRVLVAAWLAWDGERCAANQMIRSVTPCHGDEVEAGLDRLVELIDRRRAADDDIEHYVFTYGGHKGQGVTWDEYRVGELEDLDGDLRAEAQAIAALADRSVAA